MDPLPVKTEANDVIAVLISTLTADTVHFSANGDKYDAGAEFGKIPHCRLWHIILGNNVSTAGHLLDPEVKSDIF